MPSTATYSPKRFRGGSSGSLPQVPCIGFFNLPSHTSYKNHSVMRMRSAFFRTISYSSQQSACVTFFSSQKSCTTFGKSFALPLELGCDALRMFTSSSILAVYSMRQDSPSIVTSVRRGNLFHSSQTKLPSSPTEPGSYLTGGSRARRAH